MSIEEKRNLDRDRLLELAAEEGTPLFIIDHALLRRNYQTFKTLLPRIQCYYAVKANSNQEVIKTLFNAGSSFDVASYNEFMQVYEYIKGIGEKDQDFFVWDKIIFSNTIKDRDTLRKINGYKPLVTYDNSDEIAKIKEYCPNAGLVLRLKVPDIGSQVEMSSKFGAEPAEAAALISRAFDSGLEVEGLSFHVGSQCVRFDNYTTALAIASQVLHNSRKKGYNLKLVDIGGGFPAPYNPQVPRFADLAAILNTEIERLFPGDVELIAEPGRFMVGNTATLVTEIIGRARRNGKRFYHINDGIYHSFSGIAFDHWVPNFTAFRAGREEVCAVVGPTCDSLDKITLSARLPGELIIGDYLYTENIGAYSIASATKFNGFDGAKIIHINREPI